MRATRSLPPPRPIEHEGTRLHARRGEKRSASPHGASARRPLVSRPSSAAPHRRCEDLRGPRQRRSRARARFCRDPPRRRSQGCDRTHPLRQGRLRNQALGRKRPALPRGGPAHEARPFPRSRRKDATARSPLAPGRSRRETRGDRGPSGRLARSRRPAPRGFRGSRSAFPRLHHSRGEARHADKLQGGDE